MLTDSQRRYIWHWVRLVVAAEAVMLACNRYLPMAYIVIAFLFFCGLTLRALRLYPGKAEPLVLDASAGAISIIFAVIAHGIMVSGIRFLLILISSLIILPHIAYIVSTRDI